MHIKPLVISALLSLLPLGSQNLLAAPTTQEMRAESYSFFVPPEGWQLADPRTLSPRVLIAFLGENSAGFCPSLNLAVEEANVSLSSYLKAVKAIHLADSRNRWRDVGKIQTRAGEARLTEIDTQTEWGPVRLLQMIFLKDRKAYVLTGAALKEECGKLYKDFSKAFRSFTLTSDLFSSIPQEDRREILKKMYDNLKTATTPRESIEQLHDDKEFQEKLWQPFQNKVLNDFADMGAHWQVLMLQTSQQGLLK